MKTVVTGVIGSDVHAIGNWLLRRSLEKAGFRVVALGTQVSQQEFIDAAVESKADAILVSSIYGQAFLDCEGFREKCVESGLKDILLYIGGSLSILMYSVGSLAIERERWEDIEKRFKEIGFDRVYPPDTLPATAIEDLNRDLQRKEV